MNLENGDRLLFAVRLAEYVPIQGIRFTTFSTIIAYVIAESGAVSMNRMKSRQTVEVACIFTA